MRTANLVAFLTGAAVVIVTGSWFFASGLSLLALVSVAVAPRLGDLIGDLSVAADM